MASTPTIANRRIATVAAVAAVALAVVVATIGCSTSAKTTNAAPNNKTSSNETTNGTDVPVVAPVGKRKEIVLLAYDSFVLSKGVIEGFTATTGIPVKVITQGDAGELVNSAILTKGSPESGVLWGVDSTFLTRAIDEKLFVPYESSVAGDLDPKLRALAPGNEVTPVDRGDVCVNYDRAALTAKGIKAPATLSDLIDPRYKGMLVVQSPATSSPGLAFLLATIARFGEDPTTGWKSYWKALKANDMKIVSGWTEAYETWFSAGGAKGDRPLVVSYGTSPVAAVLFGADPKAAVAPTGVLEDTCYRQVEFAGVLGGPAQDEARALLDFLVSPVVQEDIQLNQFVYPANTKAKIDPAFTKFAVQPATSTELPPAEIAKNRERWIDEWTALIG